MTSTWIGHDLDMIWTWFGHALGMLWTWFGHDLDMNLKGYASAADLLWRCVFLVCSSSQSCVCWIVMSDRCCSGWVIVIVCLCRLSLQNLMSKVAKVNLSCCTLCVFLQRQLRHLRCVPGTCDSNASALGRSSDLCACMYAWSCRCLKVRYFKREVMCFHALIAIR